MSLNELLKFLIVANKLCQLALDMPVLNSVLQSDTAIRVWLFFCNNWLVQLKHVFILPLAVFAFDVPMLGRTRMQYQSCIK